MKRFRRSFEEGSADELIRERTGAETVLNQRLILFLVVFAVVIVSALNAQRKVFFLTLLFAGVVICWVLAYIVIISARKVGYIVKRLYEVDSELKKADRKGGGRSARFLLGYFIPIFCTTLLTIAFVTGAFGFMDPYLWPTTISTTKIENKAQEIGTEIKKQLEPKKDETAGHFRSVDSVILLSKSVVDGKTNTATNVNQNSKTATSANKYSKNFKSVDSVIALGNPPAKRKAQPTQSISKKQALKELENLDSHFKTLDSVSVNVNPTKVIKKTKSVSVDTGKSKTKKAIPPSPHFENVDSVITKPK